MTIMGGSIALRNILPLAIIERREYNAKNYINRC